MLQVAEVGHDLCYTNRAGVINCMKVCVGRSCGYLLAARVVRPKKGERHDVAVEVVKTDGLKIFLRPSAIGDW